VCISAGKAGVMDSNQLAPVVASMIKLNRVASEVMLEYQACACTDITGFGLAGHAMEMARGSHVELRISISGIPFFSCALDLIANGIKTGLTDANRCYNEGEISFDASICDAEKELFYDPQTAGGLMIAARQSDADNLLKSLHRRGITEARIIGECIECDGPHIQIVR
jgi:selenide,water dikinase